jgi:phosphate transport system permease protein
LAQGPTHVRARRRRTLGELLFQGISGTAAAIVLFLLGLLAIVLLQGAWLSLTTFGPSFLAGTNWYVGNVQSQDSFGALPFIYGTLVTSILAMLIGVPISLGIAIFLTELAPRWLRSPLSFLVELLAAVPSVVYGLWGLFVLAPYLQTTLDPTLVATLGWTGLFHGSSGQNKLTAGIILAIMVIPTITAISRESMRAVPDAQREAALSLGATSWETTRVSVLTYARAGIFGASILGLGRAVGETIAVTMTIGNIGLISGSLLAPGQSLASQIATSFAGDATDPLATSAALELAVVLLAISLAINVGATLLVRRFLHIDVGEGTG